MTADPFDAALTGFERWTATTKRKLSADPVGEVAAEQDAGHSAEEQQRAEQPRHLEHGHPVAAYEE